MQDLKPNARYQERKIMMIMTVDNYPMNGIQRKRKMENIDKVSRIHKTLRIKRKLKEKTPSIKNKFEISEPMLLTIEYN